MLFTTSLALLVSLSAAQLPTCNNRFVRKEIRELVDTATGTLLPEGQDFIAGIQCVVGRPGANNGHHLWDDFTRAHALAGQEAHGNNNFLPWHRLFVIHMEKAMTDCLGRQVIMPYWDGSLDSQAPESSVLWQFIGGNGVAGQANCVTSGPMNSVTFQNPATGCLVRTFGNGNLPPPETIALFRASSVGDYTTFRTTLETTYHAAVHIFAGGHMADTNAAPNDPLFYMHHAFIDKMYADWQNSNVENTFFGDEGFLLNMHDVQPILGSRTVREVLKTTDWCYTYSNGVAPIDGIPEENSVEPLQATVGGGTPITVLNPTGGTSAALPGMPSFIGDLFRRSGLFAQPAAETMEVYEGRAASNTTDGAAANATQPVVVDTSTPSCFDRTNMKNIRAIDPIPLSYIKMMHFDEAQVRDTEAKMNRFIAYVNNGTYESDCALERLKKAEYAPLTDTQAQEKRVLLDSIADMAIKDMPELVY